MANNITVSISNFSSDNEPDDASLGSLFADENDSTDTHYPTSSLIQNNDNFNTSSLLTHDNNNINTPPLLTNNDDITTFQVSSSADNLTLKQPAQFQQFNNEFEIAWWLAHQKRILDLATNIRKAKLTKVDKEDNSTSTSTDTILNEPVSKLPEIDQECKALFLRTRNNTTVLYEELITKVSKISKTDRRLGSLVKDIGGWYNSYRHKFHIALINLANEFRSTNESAKEPYDELDEFVSDDVWKQILKMHIQATDQTKLKQDRETYIKLGVFVRQITKAILIAQDKNKNTQNVIRKHDECTIDLKIPTKLGIVESLPVRELLD
ncbi:7758_t:CDS:2, partial [Dentiscutata heterogama]